ncbi:MAG TPA: 50S ribosomal protein L1 [Candidatus Saccharimonadales bacterium]|nr:50S ribosomal protein L1 [Candidatus Saccharimonadales bacterium]
MAKTKTDWLNEAKDLGIKVEPSTKIADLKKLIDDHNMPSKRAKSKDNESELPSDKIAAVAKAGKRSAKAIQEAEAEQAKAEQNQTNKGAEATNKPRPVVKPTRSRLERHGKKFRELAKLIEKGKKYGLEEAVDLAHKTNAAKFDATVEVHVNLNVDPRQADQNVRDTIVLPSGTGKNVRIAVFTDDTSAAKKAGASIAGDQEILAQLDKGIMEFDVLIATPANMPKLGKYARILGPRGLMPNPKSGTVTTDISKAVTEAKAGRVEYRVDSTGIIHLGIGKSSFTTVQLLQNVQALLTSVKANKPQSVKGNYFKAVYLATTMGPSISVDIASVS